MKCHAAGVYLAVAKSREALMRKSNLLATTLVLGAALGAANIAAAMETNSPAPPQQPQSQQPSQGHKAHTTKKLKQKKNSAIDKFYAGYHTAYAQIYDQADYAGGIATL